MKTIFRILICEDKEQPAKALAEHLLRLTDAFEDVEVIIDLASAGDVLFREVKTVGSVSDAIGMTRSGSRQAPTCDFCKKDLDYDVIVLDIQMTFQARHKLKDYGIPESLVEYAGLYIAQALRQRLEKNEQRTIPAVLVQSAYLLDDPKVKDSEDLKALRDRGVLVDWEKSPLEGESVWKNIASFVRGRILMARLRTRLGTAVFAQLLLAAQGNHNVLIVGRTGAGKDRAARILHTLWLLSNYREQLDTEIRHDSPLPRWEPLNCAGLTDTLARAELFGAVKGAYTDAKFHQLGRCLRASGLISPASQVAVPEEIRKQVTQRLQEVKTIVKQLRSASDDLALASSSDEDTGRPQELISRGLQACQAGVDALNAFLEAGTHKAHELLNLFAQTVGIEGPVSYRRWLRTTDEQRVPEGDELTFELLPLEQLYGTLFLDEIGDLAAPVQPTVLRYLNDYEIQPLGYSGVIGNVRARIIAATNHPDAFRLAGIPDSEQVDRSSRAEFRPDLFYRLAEQVIHIPDLQAQEVQGFVEEVTRQLQHDEGLEPVGFDNEAVEHLRELVENKLIQGQRRELVNIIKMAARVVGSRFRTGLSISQKVDLDLLKSASRPMRLDVAALEALVDAKRNAAEGTSKQQEATTRAPELEPHFDTSGPEGVAFRAGLIGRQQEFASLPTMTRIACAYCASVKPGEGEPWSSVKEDCQQLRVLALVQAQHDNWIRSEHVGDLLRAVPQGDRTCEARLRPILSTFDGSSLREQARAYLRSSLQPDSSVDLLGGE